MLIDTSLDFRDDCPDGKKDPDKYSPALRQYHKLLWSKALPSGRIFDLNVRGACFHHSSEIGEFYLSSDNIIQTFTKHKRKSIQRITNLFTEEENEEFRRLSYTIGGMIVFPKNQINRKWTINQHRGCHGKIRDRFDLTLECIRRHYLGQCSPLDETLARYSDFFALFEDFRGYVDFFMLQDLVNIDGSAVRFFMPFDGFSTQSAPWDGDSYEEYRRLSLEFIEARNRRLKLWNEGSICRSYIVSGVKGPS